ALSVALGLATYSTQSLTGILPNGARTFLPMLVHPAIAWPTFRGGLYADRDRGPVNNAAQHETGVHAGHPLDAGDLVEQQVLVGVHVADDDLQLVVRLLAGDQQAFEDFRNFRNAGFQIGEAFRRVLVHRDADQRHQRQAELFGIEQGAVAGDQARLLQRPYPTQAGGGRKTDTVSQFLVADPSILLQDRKNLPVVAIKFHKLLNSSSY